jgi:hypothetical protein
MRKQKKKQTSAADLKQVRKDLAKAAKERHQKGSLYAVSSDGKRFALVMLLKCKREGHKLKMTFIVIKPGKTGLKAADKVTFKSIVRRAMKARIVSFLIPVKETLFKSLSNGDRFLYKGRIFEKTTDNPTEKENEPTDLSLNEGWGVMVIPNKSEYERFCNQQAVWHCLAKTGLDQPSEEKPANDQQP